MIGDFLDKAKEEGAGKHSQYKHYEKSKKEITNMGIERMLVDGSQNQELQNYLNEKAYETASLGETSADELVVQPSSGGEGSQVDILRNHDDIATKYDEITSLAGEVKDFENDVYADHLALDLYRSKGKSKNKISFKDLSLQENLNYIKYTLKNTDEAFDLFKITQYSFTDSKAQIPAALIQKIATRAKDIHRKDVADKIMETLSYKQMLWHVKQGLGDLDNRNFVDTVFAIGKLH